MPTGSKVKTKYEQMLGMLGKGYDIPYELLFKERQSSRQARGVMQVFICSVCGSECETFSKIKTLDCCGKSAVKVFGV